MSRVDCWWQFNKWLLRQALWALLLCGVAPEALLEVAGYLGLRGANDPVWEAFTAALILKVLTATFYTVWTHSIPVALAQADAGGEG